MSSESSDLQQGRAHAIAARLLAWTGRGYKIDPRIPVTMLIGEVMGRLIQLLRGLMRLRTPVFLGRSVTIRGKRAMALAKGVSIGDDCVLDARGKRGIRMAKSSRLGRSGVITAVSRLSLRGEGVVIGENSGIGDFFHLGASGGIVIGANVIVGPGLYVHSQSHIFADPDVPIRDQGTEERPVVVADDCWIGSRVTLLAGTSIGPRTVIAAGAVVSGDHPGHEVLAGVPARRVKELP
jgi:acetyltransferase-like isoleucine patch superfamily enzyme